MSARVLLFPKNDPVAAGRSLDPNLAKLFGGDEVYEAWDELEFVATKRVRDLLARRTARLGETDCLPTDEYVAKIAAFFLRRASERAVTRLPSMPLKRPE